MVDFSPSFSPESGPPPRPVRVRFAPSPTGTLHIGSARTALYNYLFARHVDGALVLRVEDTDTARSRREFEESILTDLKWLGLHWDEGPDAGGDHGPYRQSERAQAGLYQHAAERLLDSGRTYYCFCSQERLEQLKQENLDSGKMPKYDRRCAGISRDEAQSRLGAGEPATIRFRVPDEGVAVDDLIHGRVDFSHEVIGDFIIIRSGGGVSYNFAVVIDDAAMAITHVIRGEDHLTNTARQLMVFGALGEEPPAYAHHSLIMGPDGAKLSKRHGATSVGDFRDRGYLPSAINNYLALLSWAPSGEREKLGVVEMEKEFELSRVSRSPAIFDVKKLDWLNGLYIRDLDPGKLRRAITPFKGEMPAGAGGARLEVAEAAIQTSLVTLADAGRLLDEFFAEPQFEGEDAAEVAAALADPQAGAVLDAALARAASLPDTGDDGAEAAADAITAAREWLDVMKKECREAEIPPKRLFTTLRLALTGKPSGPELFYLLAGLGRDVVTARLTAARETAGRK